MILFEIVAKSVGILMAAGLLSLLIRRASAAARHAVWALAFLGLALLPITAIYLPSLTIERPIQAPLSAPVTVPSPRPLVRPLPVEKSIAPPEPAVARNNFPWAAWLQMLWVAGVGLSLGHMLLLLLQVLRIARRARAIPDPAYPSVRILVSPEVDVPMTFGVFRPTILLPDGSLHWSDERRRAVLLHECAHIERFDWAGLVLARIVSALYWPNPLVWLAAARLRAESEAATDDAVLREGLSAPQYAETLVELAEGLRRQRTLGLPIVGSGTLRSRVAGILRTGVRRGPLRKGTAALCVLFALASVLPFAAARWIEGPVVVAAGQYDLGNGHAISLFAITETNGKTVRTWNMRGELFPEAMPIDADTQRILIEQGDISNPRPSGPLVRYLVFRTDLQGDQGLDFAMKSEPSPRMMWPYPSYPNNYQDATGGLLHVARGDFPTAEKGRIEVWAPNSDWIEQETVPVRNGVVDLNPAARLGLWIVPSRQGREVDSIRVLLPESFSTEQAMLRVVTAKGAMGYSFPRYATGRQTLDFVREKPEEIVALRLEHRTVKHLVFDNIPLLPSSSKAQEPNSFSPNGLIQAVNGEASLPDGTRLSIAAIGDFEGPRGRRWDLAGHPETKERPYAFQFRYPPSKSEIQNSRYVGLVLKKSPEKTGTWIQAYDGAGVALRMHSTSTIFAPDGVYTVLSSLVGRSRKSTNLVVRLPIGEYRKVTQAVVNVTPGFASSYKAGVSLSDGLQISLPEGMMKSRGDVDLKMVAVDSAGKEVSEQGTTTSWSDKQVTFHFSPSVAKRVKGLEVRVRPFAWVKFENVPLYPAQDRP